MLRTCRVCEKEFEVPAAKHNQRNCGSECSRIDQKEYKAFLDRIYYRDHRSKMRERKEQLLERNPTANTERARLWKERHREAYLARKRKDNAKVRRKRLLADLAKAQQILQSEDTQCLQKQPC